MAQPREIDQALVDAYLARRALDYLVGFTLSPVLWRKLPGARSAGRVQSVALRLVCDREREIETFDPREYWSIDASSPRRMAATFRGTRSSAPTARKSRVSMSEPRRGRGVRHDAELGRFQVAARRGEAGASAIPRRRSRPRRCSRKPRASSALRPRAPCRLAQRLYEGAEIGGETVGPHHLYANRRRRYGGEASDRQLAASSAAIRRPNMCPEAPRKYTSKVKNAQEAHEAIRPTDAAACPSRSRKNVDDDQCAALRADLDARGRKPDGVGRAGADNGRYRRQAGRAHHQHARHGHRSSSSTASSRFIRKAATTRRTRTPGACRRCRSGER